MMKTKTIGNILFISIILICYSCNKEYKNSKSQRITLNVDSIISDKVVHYSDLFSHFKIIPLETKEECLINTITDIEFIDDTLYIFDRSIKSVLIYSKEGKFIRKIYRIGKGPDEYLESFDFDFDPNEKTINVLDWSLKKINVYNSKGHFQRKIDVEKRFSSFVITKDGIYLYLPVPEFHNQSEYYLIHFLNQQGTVLWEKLKSSDFIRGPNILVSNQGGNFFRSDSDIKFYTAFSNIIYSINNKSIQPYIELYTEKFKLTDKDLKNFTYENFSFSELEKLGKLTNIFSYSDNNNLAFFKFNIGNKEYKTFYYFISKKIICSYRYIDDLSYTYPDFLKICNNQLIGYITPSIKLSNLKKMINNGKIVLTDIEKNAILQCSDYNNPFILIFDVKEN